MNPIWTPTTVFLLGDVIVDQHGNVQQVTTAGTSGLNAPPFAAVVGTTTTEGPDTLVWTCVAVLQQAATYATTTDIVDSFPYRDLVQLTNEDPTVLTIDLARIQTQLAQASRVIDSYIESRFALPLPRIPESLRVACIDIAMYRIQCLRPIHDLEDARKRYDDALKFLTMVNQEKLSLGLDSLEKPAPVATNASTLTSGVADLTTRTEQQASQGLAQVFDRRSMRTF